MIWNRGFEGGFEGGQEVAWEAVAGVEVGREVRGGGEVDLY